MIILAIEAILFILLIAMFIMDARDRKNATLLPPISDAHIKDILKQR